MTQSAHDPPRHDAPIAYQPGDVGRIGNPSHRSARHDAPAAHRAGDSVALFVPCYIDQLYPSVGQAVFTLFERLGIPLDYPEQQTCCGQPAFNSGYWEEARPVVRHFARVFGQYRWIVVPSGSCAAMARVFFAHLGSDPQVVETGRRVYELSDFLVNVLGVTDTGARFPHRITYHDSCHARRELGLLEPPRRLIQAVRDATLCELPEAEECCGFGGTFSVKLAGTSLAMGRDKARHILESGADVVVSGDASCLMQIGGVLRRDPALRNIRTMHLAELLVARE